MHVLDNAVWHALTGPHATVAERVALAARYLPDVSVFAGIADEAPTDAWDGLRDLVGPGEVAVLARPGLTVPDDWSVLFSRPCRQMWLPNPLADESVIGDGSIDDGSPELVQRLGASDVAEMLALVERTDPGPFRVRTIELGTYVGVRESGALIAMAGERMHPAGFTEISAVCTDSAHRGRGLASRLIRTIVEGIRGRGETPFLHLTTKNEPAHRVYSALGFQNRALLDVTGVRAPA